MKLFNRTKHVKKNELLFAKVKENAIIPTKRKEDSGYDVYAYLEDENDIILIPRLQTVLIPTGIASAINKNYYIQIEERGSTAKYNMKRSAGVIDSGYRGEWFIAITNCSMNNIIISKLTKDEIFDNFNSIQIDDRYISKNEVTVYPSTKAIAQAIIHKVPKMKVKEINYLELNTYTSERGSGKVGSSGK